MQGRTMLKFFGWGWGVWGGGGGWGATLCIQDCNQFILSIKVPLFVMAHHIWR